MATRWSIRRTSSRSWARPERPGRGAAAAALALGCVWLGTVSVPVRAHESEGSDVVRVQLQLPPAQAGLAAVTAVAVQIGENRHLQLDTAAGRHTVDLGPIERGWTTFRLSGLQWSPPADAAPRSCSGSFEASASRSYRVVARVESGRLQCAIR